MQHVKAQQGLLKGSHEALIVGKGYMALTAGLLLCMLSFAMFPAGCLSAFIQHEQDRLCQVEGRGQP